MPHPESPGPSGSAASQEGALQPQGASRRLLQLLRERDRLLKSIAHKRRDLERLRQELERQAITLGSRLEPLTERLRGLDAEMHVLFGELLKKGRLPGRQARDVRALYQMLQAQGVLTPAADARAAREREAAEQEEPRAPATEAPETARRVDGALRERLRDAFRRLANVLHPDKAAGAADVASRTEAMKDLNRAYREGDLARLLEIERSWGRGAAVGAGAGDADGQCEALARTNRDLAAQLRQLMLELREVRQSELGRLVGDHKRRRGGIELVDRLEREGLEEIERLTELRDLARAFRDGKISLAEFLAGPRPEAEEDELDDLELEAVFERLETLVRDGSAVAGRGGRRRGRGRSRR